MSKNNPLLPILLGLGVILFQSLPTKAIMFEPPKREAPKRTTGGASRDGEQCLSGATTTDNSLTPLLPSSSLGLTVAEHPTVFIYIPQTSADAVFFSLQDEQENSYYQKTLKLPDHPGVIAINLPNNIPPLQVGKNYQWSLAMICGQELEPDSPVVTGWIRRVDPNLETEHQQGLQTSLQSANMLARDGIWYDALATLAQLRRSQPENRLIIAHWEELLTSVGLNAIAKSPLTYY